jgi:hypothetical protein
MQSFGRYLTTKPKLVSTAFSASIFLALFILGLPVPQDRKGGDWGEEGKEGEVSTGRPPREIKG